MSMKLLLSLFLAFVAATAAEAQDTPVGTPQPAASPSSPPPPAADEPAETVKPAVPVAPVQPPTFTQDQVREIETALKKQMMLVSMGSGVVGLLIGMMIGRKSAPRPTGRRY
jgi:hypothetical protein